MYTYKKSLGKSSGWTIISVIDYTISISKYNPQLEAVILNYQNNYTIQEKA